MKLAATLLLAGYLLVLCLWLTEPLCPRNTRATQSRSGWHCTALPVG